MKRQRRWTDPPGTAYHERMERSGSAHPRHPRRTSTIRGVLLAGFGVVFSLWLVSGYELLRSMRDVEQRTTLAYQSFLRGEQVLTTVRTRVLLGSIYLRDALVSDTPEMRTGYQAELVRVRTDVDRALPAYLPLVDTPREREQWARLQVELDKYWKSREAAFTMEAESDEDSAAVIRATVVPARASILEIVDSLSALERASREHHELEAAQFYRSTQTRIITLTTITLLIGVIVAFVAANHVGRLQREIELQQAAERQSHHDLERLSTKLVNAQEEERRSLARELHDAVGQALTAIKMEMGVALRGVEADSKARRALDEARAIAESTLQNVRDLSQLLHPSMLDDFGLPETLRTHLRSFSTRTGIRAQLTHERMTDRLPPALEVCVYRIVQEALTNVARHSGASSCTVSLIRRDGFVHLTIEDDGRGFNNAVIRTADERRGLGLIGMRERAQAQAGTFRIENRREGGTRVIVRLPAPAESHVTVESPAKAEQLAG